MAPASRAVRIACGDHAGGAFAGVGLAARSRIPAITGARAAGADRGHQRGESFAQDLFPGDLGMPVGGALFGVAVDRAQQ